MDPHTAVAAADGGMRKNANTWTNGGGGGGGGD